MVTPASVGRSVRKARKEKGLTQEDLALASGTGLRFISDLESGKETCQLGKVLAVLNSLAIDLLDEDPGRAL
jgi:HTH-type transcriptional regulator / antitoxin HipB